MHRKHYFKLANYLGTFEFYLKDCGTWIDNDFEDIDQEFNSLVDNVVNLCLDDNKAFRPQTFRDEIESVRAKRQKIYNNS
tara:strand:+ start:611 stop:850 length:240 start_codon:yes stop_codon:yes gene_type:complete